MSMGIYLSNMEMPKEDSWITVRIYPDGTCAVPNWQGDCTLIEGAKAVPVPPHGRCIDADTTDIYRREERVYVDIENSPFSEYLEGDKDGLHEAAKCLSTAPTIIPADPAEEGET